MAAMNRVSPLKPGLRGARNWVTAQVRAANYSRRGFWRLFMSVFLIFALILFAGLWLGGFLPQAKKSSHDFMKNRLMSLGFVVEQVDVLGQGSLSERDIMRAIGVQPGDYLFELDLEAAQNRVENITWVERAVVRRLWPDRIVVQVIERKAYALWQNDGEFMLVDKQGEVITTASQESHTDLPWIIGTDAPANFKTFQTKLSDYPDVNNRVSSFVYHNTERWDLLIDDGDMRVKLPAGNTDDALQSLSVLQARYKVFDREIQAIDLRLGDRITFAPLENEPA